MGLNAICSAVKKEEKTNFLFSLLLSLTSLYQLTWTSPIAEAPWCYLKSDIFAIVNVEKTRPASRINSLLPDSGNHNKQ